MRFTDKDPDGNSFYNRPLTGKVKKWSPSDFSSGKKGEEVFNYHFVYARMTYWELTYLHSLIEEFKDLYVPQYRKLEIWRALNWAPISEQFAFVMPDNSFYKKAKTFADNITIKSDTFNYNKNFIGFWVEPYNETLIANETNKPEWLGYSYDVSDEFIMEYYDISPKRPSGKPEYKVSKIRSVVPAFVLDRKNGEWDGTIPGRTNKIQNPFVVNENGDILKINNLDSVIRTKMGGYKYKGKEIPDQEIIHYIRRKYGFAHTVDNSYNKDSGLPQAHWYVIPFFDDEPNKSLNLGEYLYRGESYFLVDKSITLRDQTAAAKSATSQIWNVMGFTYRFGQDEILSITNSLVWVLIRRNREPFFPPNNWQTSWNQIFHFSTIRAYWRAAKILDEVSKFASFVSDGINTGKVLTVAGEVGPDSDIKLFDNTLKSMYGISDQQLSLNTNVIDRQTKKSVFFISGESYKEHTGKHLGNDVNDIDQRVENLVTARLDYDFLSINRRSAFMRRVENRPWSDIFKYSTDGKHSYDSDRNVLNNGECKSSTQYMRHILFPNISPYLSDVLYDNTQILYTKKAVNEMACFYKPLLVELFKQKNLDNVTTFFAKNFIEKPLDPNYGSLIQYMKDIKAPTVTTALTIFALAEIAHTVGHSYEAFSHFMHNIVGYGEKFLTAYKVFLSLYKGEYVTAVRDVGIYALGTYLSAGAPVSIGVTAIPKLAGGLVGLAITFVAFAYDTYKYAKKNAIPMDEFISLVNTATDRGFLEGPYAQTKGMVKIKKGPEGSLPINLKISSDGKTVSNEYENFQSHQSKIDNETQQQKIERLNKEFLQTNSRWETKFFNQLEKIECKTLLDIAKKRIESNGRYNPSLNEAPNHIDVGAFKTKSSIDPISNIDKMGFKTTDTFPFFKWYTTIVLKDTYKIEPDGFRFYDEKEFIAKTIDDELLNSSVPKGTLSDRDAQKIRTKFKYTRKTITMGTDLTSYLNGTEIPSEFIIIGRKTAGPVFYNYNIPVKITDKEKVYLIRKKYGLDEVLPGGNCCSVFDVPADKNIFPITTDCQYLYDFTSPAFIKKLEEFCGKKEEEDKNKENEKLIKAILGDQKIATTHGQTEEKRVQHAIKMDESRKQDDRRNKKRNTSGYQGTPDSIQNLAQAPRLGVQALIPGNISYDLPITDSESQQRIAFETLDTERDKTSSLIANLVINLVGALVRKSISESLYPSRNPPSKPSETQGTLPETQVIAEKPFVLVSDGGIVYAQYYEPSTSKRLHRVPYSPKKK